MRTGVNIVASRGSRVRLTDGEVRKRFVYGEHIARCTVRWAVWGLKIVVRDEVVFGVQALGAAMREMSILYLGKTSNFEFSPSIRALRPCDDSTYIPSHPKP
jgi:hypothetical protein